MKKIDNILLKSGTPQTIGRVIKLDGRDVLIRLQKPFEERDARVEEYMEELEAALGDVTDLEIDIDSEIPEFGCYIIFEAWSDATNSVVTEGITKTDGQREEDFAFSARYMLNYGTDSDWEQIVRARGIDKVFNATCINTATSFVEPKVKDKSKDE